MSLKRLVGPRHVKLILQGYHRPSAGSAAQQLPAGRIENNRVPLLGSSMQSYHFATTRVAPDSLVAVMDDKPQLTES